MFVIRNAFMIKSARKLNSVTIKCIPRQTSGNIIKILNKVIKLYGIGGFVINVILTDMEFNKGA